MIEGEPDREGKEARERHFVEDGGSNRRERKRDMRKKRSETRCWTGRKKRKNMDANEGDTENGRKGNWWWSK